MLVLTGLTQAPIVASSLLLHSNLNSPLCSLIHPAAETNIGHSSHIVGRCTAQPAQVQLMLSVRNCISQSVTKDVIPITFSGTFPTPICLCKLKEKGKNVKRNKKSLSWYINLWYLNASENLKEIKKQSGYTTPNNVVRRSVKSKVIKQVNRKWVRR